MSLYNDIFPYTCTFFINYPILDTKLKEKILNYPKKFKIFNNDERLDTLSFKLYGDTKYWYILAFFNGIKDPFNIKDYQYIYYVPEDDLRKMIQER